MDLQNNSNINILNIEKSFINIINYKLSETDKNLSIIYLFHFIPLRTDVSFISLFYYNPENSIFFCTKSSKNEFIKKLKLIKKWYDATFFSNLPPFLQKYYGKNFLNIYNFTFVDIGGNLDNYEYFTNLFDEKIKQVFNFNEISTNNIMVDISGGKKLHSVIMADIAKKYNIPYSYISAIENKNMDNISALNGTEVIYEKYFNNITLKEKFIFPFLSILMEKDNFIMFYNNKFFKFSFLEIIKNKNEIDKKYFNLVNIINSTIKKGFENLIITLYDEFKTYLKSLLDKTFLSILANYSEKVLLITTSKELFNFPVNLFFENKIVIKTIAPAKYHNYNNNKINNDGCNINNINSNKNNNFNHYDNYNNNNHIEIDKNLKKPGLKFLIIKMERDDEYQKKEIIFIKKILKRYNSIINYFIINLEDLNKTEINNKTKNLIEHTFDIIHYTGHTGFDSSGFYFSNGKTKILIYSEPFNSYFRALLFNTKFVFLNSCSSASLFMNYDKSIYKILAQCNIRCFIGTNYLLNTEKALNFITLFYTNLFTKHSIYKSFLNAQIQIQDDIIKENYQIYGNPFFRFENEN